MRSGTTPETPEAAARLFFALWPDEEVRAELGALARQLRGLCGGRAVPAQNIHLTLAFLGNVPVRRIAELRALGDGIRGRAFGLTVDTLAYWRHNRIVWAGMSRCPDPLRVLAAALGERLKPAGFRTENREFVPHITLVRDARRDVPPEARCRIDWQIGEFVLVQSVPHGGATAYETIGSWKLVAAGSEER
jgi:2'-5' RNA ligase